MTTEFERHYDNIGEIIDAQDVNELQDVININEQNIQMLRDVDFEDFSLWLLKNREEFNRLWIDTFNDKTKIDEVESSKLIYLPKDRMVKVRRDQDFAELYSKAYNDDENINRAILLTQTAVHNSEDLIKFQISINGMSFEDIQPNELFEPDNIGNSFKLKALFNKDSEKGPELYRWALLWG